MTHYRVVERLVVGLVLSVVVAACSGGSTDSTVPPGETRILDADRIGLVDIGQPPAAAIEELTASFGAPDTDSMWIDADSPLYGNCPGAALRAVGWGSLYLFFTADEGVTEENENVVARLLTYSYGYDFARNEGATDPRQLQLQTADGIGLGSTRLDLRAAYGEQLIEAYDEVADTWTWSAPDTGRGVLQGLLAGPEDDARVVLIERGPGCLID